MGSRAEGVGVGVGVGVRSLSAPPVASPAHLA